MKIPVYQRQVEYRGATARDVQLAAPQAQASRKKIWADVAGAGGVLTGAGWMYYGLIGKKQSGKDEEKEEENSGGSEEKSRTKTEAAYTGFSRPERRELLHFGQEKAFGASSDSEDGGADAVTRLDDFFRSRLQGAAQSTEPDRDLLTQDYVVLRREVQALQDKNERTLKRDLFNRCTSDFVQTAGLVRGAQSLKNYIEANLSAAEREARAGGVTEEEWKRQKDALYSGAVRHNIEAALEAGEVAQAAAVYKRLGGKTSAEDGAVLQSKLLGRAADLEADKLLERALRQCRDEEGEVDEKRLTALTREACAEGRERREQLYGALRAKLGECVRRDWSRRAQNYVRLLETGRQTQTADLAALMGNYYRAEAEFARDANALRALRAEPGKRSDPARFNMLHGRILEGGVTLGEVDKAFDEGHICAEDCLRLKARICFGRAGERQNIRERLLGRAVERLCAGLDANGAEEAKYFVFSAGPDTRARMEAARELKRIFNLREEEK